MTDVTYNIGPTKKISKKRISYPSEEKGKRSEENLIHDDHFLLLSRPTLENAITSLSTEVIKRREFMRRPRVLYFKVQRRRLR